MERSSPDWTTVGENENSGSALFVGQPARRITVVLHGCTRIFGLVILVVLTQKRSVILYGLDMSALRFLRMAKGVRLSTKRSKVHTDCTMAAVRWLARKTYRDDDPFTST